MPIASLALVSKGGLSAIRPVRNNPMSGASPALNGNPTMSNVKQAVLELAQRLPEECTWDEVMYQIYVRQKIEAGLKDVEEGRTVTHKEVFEEYKR
jgi:hypothetical protein